MSDEASRRSWWQVRARQARNGWILLRDDGPAAFFARLSGRIRRRLESPIARWRIWIAAWDFSPVTLPAPADPVVSIVIPAHNKWRITLQCLRSIARRTAGVSYEVILVDDASTDRTRRAGEIVPGLVRVGLHANAGFVAACNAGARAARGRFVLFLNNDTLVTDGWLPALVATFADRPECAAAGAKLVYPNGSLQEAGGIVWREGEGWNFGRGGDPNSFEFNYARPVDYCSGAALMVRRDAFERVGGFDTRFSPAYWEDVDLCFSLREAGWSVWFQPASVVCHLEGLSAGTNEAKGMKRYQAVNRGVFREKWTARLAEQIPFAESNLWSASSRNRRPVLLVLDHLVPMFDRDAGSLFMHEALTHLARQGYRVVFWPDNLYRLPGYAEPLEQLGIEIVYGDVELASFLRRIGRPVDAAIAYRADVAARHLGVARPYAKALGYIAVDLEAVRETRRQAIETPAGTDPDAKALWQRETAAVTLADVAAAHSHVERARLEELVPGRRVFELPLPVARVSAGSSPFSERAGFVFVGSTHPPNVDAITYFVSAVWPRVREALGDVTLSVVGEVCLRVPELARLPGVALVGHVADLGEWLGRARVFVAPLRYGAGIKGKILTAMHAGVPVVTSGVGAEGIGLEHRRSALIADDDGEFARCAVEAYTTPALWDTLRHEAHALVSRNHSAGPFTKALDQFVAALLSSGAS